jgi:hypothetical protein
MVDSYPFTKLMNPLFLLPPHGHTVMVWEHVHSWACSISWRERQNR